MILIRNIERKRDKGKQRITYLRNLCKWFSKQGLEERNFLKITMRYKREEVDGSHVRPGRDGHREDEEDVHIFCIKNIADKKDNRLKVVLDNENTSDNTARVKNKSAETLC